MPESDEPLMDYFDGLYKGKLSRAGAAATDFDTRIASVGKFLAKAARRFHNSLSAEGKATYDPEDIILELWIALRERDDKFNQARGSYLRFAYVVVKRRLVNMAERARCVRYPPNKSFALKIDMDEIFDSGEKGKLETILRSAVDHSQLAGSIVDLKARPPIEQLISREEQARSCESVSKFLTSLTTFECIALGAAAGIWGDEPDTVMKWKAMEYNVPQRTMRRALATARIKTAEWAEDLRNKP